MAVETFHPRRAAADRTVIALHSSAAGGGQWRTYAQSLPAGVTLHTPDLIGYGSDAPWLPGARLSLDDEADRLMPLLAKASAHLVGHSYGGAVAMQLALRAPKRVLSLTLYEPVRFALLRHAAPSAWHQIRAVAADITQQLHSQQTDRAAERFVDYWGGAGSFAALPQGARQRIAARMAKVDAEFAALFADRVPLSDIARLPQPLRLLVGTRSPLPAQRVAERLASACAAAVLVRLAGAGHLAPIDQPERVLPWLPFAGVTAWPRAA
jgi:pimeloyl-ACP methyl ester carboxylesterase